MSLFERLNNKREDLYEKKEKKFPSDSSGKKKYTPPTKAESDAIQTKSLINKTKNFVNKPANTPKSKGSGTVTGSTRPLVTNPKSKGNKSVTVNVKKTTVSSDKFTRPNTNVAPSAKEITKKYNQLNKNRPEFDKSLSPSQRNLKNIQQNKGKIGKLVVNPSSAQKAKGLTPGDIDFTKSDELMKRREARINKRTGKITQKGIRDFASSFQGANKPDTKLSKSQIKGVKSTARKISIAKPGDKYYNWKKQIETKANKRDYAGKSTRKRPSNAPSYAEVKKKIDAANKTYTGKSGGQLPVAGKQSIVTPAGKLKTTPLDAGKKALFGDPVRPGDSSTYKPYYPKTKRGKAWKFIKTNAKKAFDKSVKLAKKHPKTAKVLAIGAAAYTGYKMFAPKPKKKYVPIEPVNLKLNLSSKTKNLMVDPKNPTKLVDGKKVPNKISRQSVELRDRNIYTGKLQKDVYKPKPPKPKSLSSAEIKKQYPDSVSKPSDFTKSKKYPRVSKK